MKRKLNLFPAWMLCAVTLGMGSAFSPAVAEFGDANWMSMGGIPGANGDVLAAAVDAWGNLYIGGEFTIVGDVIANHIAKWNGTNWAGLGSGMNNTVRALAVSGSNVYAGDEFTTAGGGPANRIAKWDGNIWSALGLGMGNNPGYSPAVYTLAVSGSDLYAGGGFTTAGGNPVNKIAKWNGSSWTALGSGIGSGFGTDPFLCICAGGVGQRRVCGG